MKLIAMRVGIAKSRRRMIYRIMGRWERRRRVGLVGASQQGENTVAIVQVTMQQMQERVARFNELRPSRQAFVDTRIPEHVRDIYNVIGKGVTVE